MSTDKRQFTMRMQQENFDKIRVIAAVNKRSMAMQIEYLLEQCINDYEAKYGRIPLAGDNGKNQSNVVQKIIGGKNNLAVNGNVYNR